MAVKQIGKVPFSSSQYSPLATSDIPAGVPSGIVHIQSIDAVAAASVVFSSIPNKYSMLYLLVNEFYSTATGTELSMRINEQTGVIYDFFRVETDPTPTVSSQGSVTALVLLQTNAASAASWIGTGYGRVEIVNPVGTQPILVNWSGANSLHTYSGSGRCNIAVPVSSLLLYTNTTISGKFSLFGALRATV